VVLDRNAAAVVGDGEEAVLAQMHLDARGVAGDRLVHRVVDDFGEQVVQRRGVGAANIHAGPPPNRLKTFQHLDVGSRIGVRNGRRRGGRSAFRLRHGPGSGFVAAEKVFDGRHENSVRARIVPAKL
jgi:hypothetical protein